MGTRQSRKIIQDMINTRFLTLQLSKLLLLLSFSTRKHTYTASCAILSNFFEERRTQNHPQHLSGLPRALFPTTFLEIAVDYTGQGGLEMIPRRLFSPCNSPLSPFIALYSFLLYHQRFHSKRSHTGTISLQLDVQRDVQQQVSSKRTIKNSLQFRFHPVPLDQN